ncbi:MAG TPA: cupredoxin domain-containing protein [Acidimicrobiales bacterium]|nr:cupredoxin domain-containing protein [Acidimicrobiales bacterium]
MRVKIVSAGLFSIMLALVAGGCSSGGDETLDLGESGSTVVVAKGGNSPHFDPDVIKVPVGREVTFTFKNEDTVAHNFIVSYIGVEVEAQPGQSVPVTLTAPDKGTLNFYDSKFQGEGMAGKIEVE